MTAHEASSSSSSKSKLWNSMGEVIVTTTKKRRLPITVHDHDPLGLAHLRLSLSLDTLPAGRHIRPRSRQRHSQPRPRPHHLPVLLQRQPQDPAVSDSGEQISNSIDDYPLAGLCKSFPCLSLSPDHQSTFSGHIQPDA
ncbi:hypothetical protein ACFX2I_026168 [Malus domestica]